MGDNERDGIRFQVVDYYLNKRKKIRTPKELHRLLVCWANENLNYTPVCDGHLTQFHYISYGFFETYKNILVIAPRGGGKTKATAKLNAVELAAIDGIEIASVGAIDKQAKRCYRHTKRLLDHPAIADKIIRSVMEMTELNNGSTYEQIIGTIAGVNSPHPQKLRADEVELMSPEVIQEMLMIPSTKVVNGREIKASTSLISTRKYAYGNMQNWFKNAKAKNFYPIIWCYKEIAKKCMDDRSGIKRKTFYVKDIHDVRGRNEIKVRAFEGCPDCLLVSTCKGDLKRAGGYFPIEDLIDEFVKLDTPIWISQKECLEPSPEGLVFPSFKEEIHIQKFSVSDDFKYYRSYDFGDTNPTVCLFIAVDDEENVFVYDEYYKAQRLIKEHCRNILKKSGVKFDENNKPIVNSGRFFQDDFGDPSAAIYRRELFVESGEIIKVSPAINNWIYGVNAIRELLKVSPVTKRPKLFIHPKCENLIEELKQYHKKKDNMGNFLDEAVKDFDHATDALRYFVASYKYKYELAVERPNGERPRGNSRPGRNIRANTKQSIAEIERENLKDMEERNKLKKIKRFEEIINKKTLPTKKAIFS